LDVDEADIQKARQWDKMMSQLVDIMPVADRREWLREQRLQEEARNQETWADLNSHRYVDC
jgi:hypothetical protein